VERRTINAPYTLIEDIAAHQEVPANGILTRAICNTEAAKAVLFTFAAGQELSEHTASTPAILQFVAGQARVRLGDDEHHLKAGAWVYMPANLKHSIRAETAVTMMLVLVKTPAGAR
jgi:quercetin dioxygenase-like cupin family protein